MSLCMATKFGAMAIGLSTLAQVVDPVPALGTFEKYGVTGLLILAVVALWLDGKREAAKAEERRVARETAQTARDEKFLTALNDLTSTVRENALRCDQVRETMHEATKK